MAALLGLIGGALDVSPLYLAWSSEHQLRYIIVYFFSLYSDVQCTLKNWMALFVCTNWLGVSK